MGSNKSAVYYLYQIIDDIEFVLNNVGSMSLEEFTKDELVNCAVSFKFVQISESAIKLLSCFPDLKTRIPYADLTGLRNRIVLDYGNVKLEIIYNTVFEDLPDLLLDIKAFASSLK